MSVLHGGTAADADRAPPSGGFDARSDLAYFTGLWETRGRGPVCHTPELWDSRADEWIGGLERGAGRPGMRDRAEAAALYLRNRGLLGANDSVIDVGCGPGLFVAEFAETAGHATGFDYSSRFIGYAEKYAAGRGVANVSFRVCDFTAIDIDAEGLAGAFDLVFTSITPAASAKGCMDKLIRMSRGWCYNASFVHAEDDLAERVSRDVFGERFTPRWNGSGFYALVNLLWLSGYYPETTYYDETRDEDAAPEMALASELASRCGHESGGDAGLVLRYLEKAGEIRRHSLFRYGAILWNVTQRDRR